MIYADDITIKQYETIVKFMEERILILKREFIEQTSDIQRYLKATYGHLPVSNNSILFNGKNASLYIDAGYQGRKSNLLNNYPPFTSQYQSTSSPTGAFTDCGPLPYNSE